MIAEIQSQTGDPKLNWLSSGFADLLTAGLAQAKVFELVEHAPADLLLSGAFHDDSSGFRLALEVRDAKTSKVVYSGNVSGQGTQEACQMADRAATQIVSALGPRDTYVRIQAGYSLTPKTAALEAYENGLRERDAFHREQAEDDFRKASEIDGQFVLAHFELAKEMGPWPDPDARPDIAWAAGLAPRLPIPEYYKESIHAAELYWDGRVPEATEAYQKIRVDFPDEFQPLVDLGYVYLTGYDWANAATAFQSALKMSPDDPDAKNGLAYAQAFASGKTPTTLPPPAAGEKPSPLGASELLFEATLEDLENHEPNKVLAIMSDAPWLPGARGAALMVQGETADADDEFQKLRRRLAPIAGDYNAARIEELHRLLAASYLGQNQKVVDLAAQLPPTLWPLYALPLGRADLALGKPDEARRNLEFASNLLRLKTFPPDRYRASPYVAKLAAADLTRLNRK